MGEIPSATLGSNSLVFEGQSAVSRHLRCSWCSVIWWCHPWRVWCSMLFRLRCHWWRWEIAWGRGQTPVGPQMSRTHFWKPCRPALPVGYGLSGSPWSSSLSCLLCRTYPVCRRGGCGPLCRMPSGNPSLQHRLACLGLCWCGAHLYKLDELGFTRQSFSESVLVGVQDAVSIKVFTYLWIL